MKSLFIRSLSRLLNSYQLSIPKNFKIDLIQQALFNKFNASFKVKDLERLNTTEMKIMLKVPCPSSNYDRSQIMIFKRLRNTYHIKQQNVCSRCPRSNKCPFKNQEAEQKHQAKLLKIWIIVDQDGHQLTKQHRIYEQCQEMQII